MPISITFPSSPNGREYVRAVSEGLVSPGDAHQLMDLLVAGQPHHEHALICVIGSGTSFTAEARKVFGFNDPSRNERGIPTAVVVPSVPMRVLMSFIFRMAGAEKRARIFPTETEAVAWVERALDQKG